MVICLYNRHITDGRWTFSRESYEKVTDWFDGVGALWEKNAKLLGKPQRLADESARSKIGLIERRRKTN